MVEAGSVRKLLIPLVAGLVVVGCSSPDRSSSPSTTGASTTSESPTTLPPSTAPTGPDCVGTGVAERRSVQYLADTGAAADLTTLEVIGADRPAGCGPAPVMVWVHGGGWQTGDRRHQLEDKAEWFTSRGWTLVSVNYRLSPEVQYPVHNDDVAAAVGWVLDHAGELGVDPSRLSVMGHSAGAGIAAAVATDPVHLGTVGRAPGDVRCAVFLDTEGYDVEQQAGRGIELYLDAFGEDPDVWRAASPIRHVTAGAGIPRSLVVTRGTARRQETAAEFTSALESAGVEARLLDARPLTHAEVNDAVGDPDDQLVTPALAEFLLDC